MGGVGGIVVVVLLGVRLAGMVRKNLSLGICGIFCVGSVDYFNSGLLWIFSCPPPPPL